MLNPFLSKREMISPTSRRLTASGFMNTSVRSIGLAHLLGLSSFSL